MHRVWSWYRHFVAEHLDEISITFLALLLAMAVALANAGWGVWTYLSRDPVEPTEVKLVEAVEVLDREIANLFRERSELKSRIAQREKELSLARKKIAADAREISELQESGLNANRRAAKSQQLLSQAAAKAEELADLREKHSDVQRRASSERSRAVRAERRLSQAKAQVKELRAELDTTDGYLQLMGKIYQTKAEENDALTKRIAENARVFLEVSEKKRALLWALDTGEFGDAISAYRQALALAGKAEDSEKEEGRMRSKLAWSDVQRAEDLILERARLRQFAVRLKHQTYAESAGRSGPPN